MFLTRLVLKNWRNFRDVDVPLHDRTYLLGANAMGKSNFLDVFRFLKDISKPQGGGLQKAIADRGGIQKLRCLHARKDTEVLIEVHLAEPGTPSRQWRYILGFKSEGKGAQRPAVSREEVWCDRIKVLIRPGSDDREDSNRLTQTHLEQIQTNKSFRQLAEYFSETTYLHLVPQLLKYGEIIGGRRLEDDPFGQGFLERIAKTSQKTREARLKKIASTLSLAVPQFGELRFVQDKITGRYHLEAQRKHYRPDAGWLREEHFSDGTLRLIGLLWALLEGDSLLLLEEPELSLNSGIVREIPRILHKLAQKVKRRRQIIISTHSEALLQNKAIDARGVLLFQPTGEGTEIREISNDEASDIKDGLSVADVVLSKTCPEKVGQLSFSFGE